VIDFEGGGTAVYQLPAGSDRGNFWEVVGDDGALMGPDLVRFDGPDGGRRRLPPESRSEPGPGGQPVLVALRWDAGGGRPPVIWENPYRRYGLGGADDVARADVYAGLSEAIGASRAAPAAAPGAGGAAEVPGGPPEPEGPAAWPASPPAAARIYGAPNARADQALLVALRESARRGGTWLQLPLPAGEVTAFEGLLHAEFERAYGVPPFGDPETILGHLFPRRGLVQTLH